MFLFSSDNVSQDGEWCFSNTIALFIYYLSAYLSISICKFEEFLSIKTLKFITLVTPVKMTKIRHVRGLSTVTIV